MHTVTELEIVNQALEIDFDARCLISIEEQDLIVFKGSTIKNTVRIAVVPAPWWAPSETQYDYSVKDVFMLAAYGFCRIVTINIMDDGFHG